jgi:hypothetical protein
VLRQISAGEAIGDDAAAKRSARALHDRGLVVIMTRGGWHAEISDAGRFYLEHGHHPDRAGTTDAEPEQQPKTSRAPSSTTSKRPPPHATAQIAAQRQAAATDLIAKLVEQKKMVISRPTSDEMAEWRKVVDFAKRNGLVPQGHRIEKTRRWDGLHIELYEGSHPNAKPSLDPSQRIEIPEHIDSLHPLLAHLKNPAAVLDVSAEQVTRALRIMHTVLTEADRRGYETGWADDTSVGAEIRLGTFRLYVSLTEERETRDVLPTTTDLSSKKVYDWQRFQPHTRSVPSGKLRIEVATAEGRWDRTAHWSDRQRWTIEDKVGDVLAEITRRITAEQDRITAAEQAKVQRQRDWEAAMDQARSRFHHDRRIEALNKQLDRWKRSAEIRAYCAAVEQARPTDDDTETLEAQSRWLEWCRRYADQIDPTLAGAHAPKEIEPRPDDLKPYLGRFSPYGP